MHLIGEAHRAVHLHRVVDRAQRHLDRVRLAHRHLAAHLLAAVEATGGVDTHRVGGVQLHRGSGERERDRLVVDDRVPEGATDLGVTQCLVQRPSGEAGSPGAVVDAADGHARHGVLQSVTGSADHLGIGNEKVGVAEDPLVAAGMSEHRDDALDAHAGVAHVDDESGQARPLGAKRLGISHGECDAPVGVGGVGRPLLDSVEDPTAVDPLRRGAHLPHVRSRVRFGHREAARGYSGGEVGQHPLAELGIDVQQQVARAARPMADQLVPEPVLGTAGVEHRGPRAVERFEAQARAAHLDRGKHRVEAGAGRGLAHLRVGREDVVPKSAVGAELGRMVAQRVLQRHHLGADEVAQSFAQAVEVEVAPGTLVDRRAHCFSCSAPRGNPSVRSASTFFWIWSVPP
jgi:hypothetical protein